MKKILVRLACGDGEVFKGADVEFGVGPAGELLVTSSADKAVVFGVYPADRWTGVRVLPDEVGSTIPASR